ncbi:MAG: hypothetical protein ACJAYO_001405, partial [Thalassolituus oleivorans]
RHPSLLQLASYFQTSGIDVPDQSGILLRMTVRTCAVMNNEDLATLTGAIVEVIQTTC